MTDAVERTPDQRYIIVNGRRWRATDPRIPDPLRAALVAELMAARRLVRADAAAARPRVADAKIALGERGHPWWEDPDPAALRARAAAAYRTLLRGRDGSVCPSEVARVLDGTDFRPLMELARAVAREGAATGEFVITAQGRPVEPDHRGPVRVTRGPRFPHPPTPG